MTFINHDGIPRHDLAPAEKIQTELDNYVTLYLKQEVLEESLTRSSEGFEVPPFLATRKRRAITRSKIYLFDVGVVVRRLWARDLL